MEYMKTFSIRVNYSPGCAKLTTKADKRLKNWIKRHPRDFISIKAHEDCSDPREKGIAAKRISVLQGFLEKNYVWQERISEMKVHSANCYCLKNEKFRAGLTQSVELTAFPRVRTRGGEGTPYLNLDEYFGLKVAADIVIWPESVSAELDKRKRQWLDRYPLEKWRRILGYDSFEDWVADGHYHPFIDEMTDDASVDFL